ncbi:MAG: hypothetical protein AAFW76_06890, partial [Pseudomonadota bacterium]
MTQPSIDADLVQRLRSDLGEEIARRLLASFVQEARSKTNAVVAAIGAGDVVTAREQAHALRSVSLEYGGIELAGLAGAVEKGQDVDAHVLHDCCERSVNAISALLS